MSNGLLALLGLLITALGIGVTVLVARMNIKGQARQSEQAHEREMARDAAAARRQQLDKLRDWHATQFDIAIEAKKLYVECARSLNGWANYDATLVRDDSAQADDLIRDVSNVLSRESGNAAVITACKELQIAYDSFVFSIQHRGSTTPNSMPVFQAARVLETAIQQRLSELDAQMI